MTRRLACFVLLMHCLLVRPTGVWGQCVIATQLLSALKATNTTGCVPLTVRASNDQAGAQRVRYVYEYDGRHETNVTTVSTYTYKKPGVYTLLQLSEYNGQPARACAVVWAYDTLPPVVDLVSCGTRVTLTIKDPLTYPDHYDSLRIDWGDGQTERLTGGQGSRQHSFTGLSPRTIQVRGLHTLGHCGGSARLTFTPNQPAQIQDVKPDGTRAVQISIQNPAGLALILEQQAGNGAFQAVQAVPAGATPVLRIPADSSVTTCYRLVPTGSCPGLEPSPAVCHTFPPTRSAVTQGLYFPDAFTPNNDGLNDEFGPVGISMPGTSMPGTSMPGTSMPGTSMPGISIPGTSMPGTYQFTIMDRWGRIVFTTDDPKKAWNGRLDDQPAPAGLYVYQLRIGAAGSVSYQRSGRVELVR